MPNKRLLLIISASVFGALAQPAQDRPRADDQKPGTDYEYREDLKRVVLMSGEEGMYLGRLDDAGNFVPLEGERPMRAHSGPEIDINQRIRADEPILEYRSGMLIQGKFDDHLNFVPEVGSRITPFKDYRYSKDAPRIYNLPGAFVEKKK